MSLIFRYLLHILSTLLLVHKIFIMSDIVYSSKRTKRRHLQKKVDDILRGANQKVPKLANNRLVVSSTNRFLLIMYQLYQNP